jgi:uncharacterized membrane protein
LIRKGSATPVPAGVLPELAELFAPVVALPRPPLGTDIALPSEFRSWDFIEKAWDLVKPHWLTLGLTFGLVSLIGLVPYVGTCAFLILGGAIQVGISRMVLGLIAGRTPTVGMAFEGFDKLGQAFLVQLVAGLLTTLGMALCIVPGVILAIMWMFAMPVLAETNLEFWPAMQASAELTAGYRWPLFCLLLANFVVIILGLIVCCVGVFVAEAVTMTSIALAYRFLQARKGMALATA